MTELEKVEKLRERANVSYEEAKAALEEANWDILDAMIILENQGKTAKPGNEKFTTKPEEKNEIVNLSVDKKEGNNKAKDTRETFKELGRKFRALINKTFVNYVIIKKKENVIIKLPIWIFALIIILGINVVPILIVISLFFGIRYSFEGADEMKTANAAADKAEEIAEGIANAVKDEYNKL